MTKNRQIIINYLEAMQYKPAKTRLGLTYIKPVGFSIFICKIQKDSVRFICSFVNLQDKVTVFSSDSIMINGKDSIDNFPYELALKESLCNTIIGRPVPIFTSIVRGIGL